MAKRKPVGEQLARAQTAHCALFLRRETNVTSTIAEFLKRDFELLVMNARKTVTNLN